MFTSDTRKDINNYPVDSVLKDVQDMPNLNMPSPRVRLNYVKMLYDILGYDLSPDVALAAVSEPIAQLVLSTAGGGKTTWSQIKAVEQKLLRKSKKGTGKKITGDKILCLVYNVHNVDDMKRKHAQMVNRLLAANVEGLPQIDSQINACTMHSFCEFCRKQFVAKLDYIGFSVLNENESISMMERAIKVACKLQKVSDPDTISANKVHSLYTMSKETLLPVSDLTQTDLFNDLDLSVSLLNTIFERFEAIKYKSKRFEFIDMLYKVYMLLKSDENALKQIQNYYEYIIADEVQDFTPLMWELLKLFVSDGTPLTCIGDEDQNIYSFRGASIADTLHFRDRYDNGKVHLLTENRRCPSVILEEAKRVINQNKLRFDKEIVGKKVGGEIRLMPYSTAEGQITQLIRELKKMTQDELNSTVVCYRNQEGSLLLSEMLAEEGIDFCCIKSFMPYSFELYTHVIGILNALEMPCDRDCFKNLWKVLPCKKKEFYQVIGYNAEMGKFTSGDNKLHFANYNYGNLMNYRGFSDAMDALIRLSNAIDKEPMTNIFPLVYKMLCTYFWEYRRSNMDDTEICNMFEKRVEKKFNVPKRYSEVYRDIQNAIGLCRRNTNLRAGVTLSTFHSLKGLEFDHVYALYMDNDIFPNFPLIEYKNYPSDIELALKEAETRLWYVTITRAKKDLTIFYFRDNPSKYVAEYIQLQNAKYMQPSVPTKTVDVQVNCIEDDFIDIEDFADTDECEDFLEIPESIADDDTMESKEILSASNEVHVKTVTIEDVNSFDGSKDSLKSNYLRGLFSNL